MAAEPTLAMAKGLLEDDERRNKLTDKVWEKAGGGDAIDKVAIWNAVGELNAAHGIEVGDDAKGKFAAAVEACGYTKDGTISLDDFKVAFKAILAKLVE